MSLNLSIHVRCGDRRSAQLLPWSLADRLLQKAKSPYGVGSIKDDGKRREHLLYVWPVNPRWSSTIDLTISLPQCWGNNSKLSDTIIDLDIWIFLGLFNVTTRQASLLQTVFPELPAPRLPPTRGYITCKSTKVNYSNQRTSNPGGVIRDKNVEQTKWMTTQLGWSCLWRCKLVQ